MHFYVFALDIWKSDNALLSQHPPEVDEQSHRFRDGVPLAAWFPPSAPYTMSSRYPQARTLYDLQNNTLQILVVSKALRSVMERFDGQHIEFLPITLRDHRDKVASTEYSIVNVLGLTECVDRANSSFSVDPFIPTRISHVDKLVLLQDALPTDRHLFRLKERPWAHLVSETLKKAIEDEGLTGMSFVPPEEFASAMYRCA